MYTRSIQGLAEYRKNETVVEFTCSKISIPTVPEEENNCCLRVYVFRIMSDIVKEVTNFILLLLNKQFVLITIANFFVFVGYFLPFIYIPVRAGSELKIDNYAMVMSIIGKLKT